MCFNWKGKFWNSGILEFWNWKGRFWNSGIKKADSGIPEFRIPESQNPRIL
jgi:hypothetical protein